MQGWKVLLAMLAGALFFFFVAALLMPSDYQVARPIWIPAKPEQVFDVVADLHRWDEWALWSARKDPSIRLTHEGPARGLGATLRWTSDRYGTGSRVVSEFDPPHRMTIELHHGGSRQPAIERITLQPMKDHRGPGTRVIWGMAGDVGQDLLARLKVGVMQRSAARDYEKNLWLLKRHVEQELGIPRTRKTPPPLKPVPASAR